MFAKLLKHDNRAIFKYWWIGALISSCIAVFGGVCIQILNVEYTEYELIQVLASVGTLFSVFGILLLPLFTEILILVRYYKNFFTDEGYLTFTLPVKKSQLLESKLLSAFIFNTASLLLFSVNIFVMLAIGIPENVFDPFVWRDIFEAFSEVFSFWGGYSIPYIVLGVLILIAVSLGETLFLFACITLGASIAKKHKILMSIGVYYGANMSLSFIIQLLAYGGLSTVFFLITGLSENQYLCAVVFLLVAALGISIAFAGGIYLLVLYLLDRRLNLE